MFTLIAKRKIATADNHVLVLLQQQMEQWNSLISYYMLSHGKDYLNPDTITTLLLSVLKFLQGFSQHIINLVQNYV